MPLKDFSSLLMVTLRRGDHKRDHWIVDFEANGHVCNDPKWLLNPIDLSNKDLYLCLVDGKKKLRLKLLEMSISSSIKETLSSGESLVQQSSI